MLKEKNLSISTIGPLKTFNNYLEIGLTCENEGEFDQSESSYLKAIELDPFCSEAYIGLSRVLMKVYQYTPAIEHCKKAISINPHYIDAYVTLGICYQNIGRAKNAIDCYRTALDFDDTKFDLYYNLALSYESLGAFEEAKFYYKHTLEINSDHSTSYRRLVEFVEGDELLEAMDSIKALISRSLNVNDQIELSFAAARAYEKIGNLDDAYEFIEQGNRLKWHNVSNQDKYISNQFAGLRKSAKRIEGIQINPGGFSQTPIFIVGMPRSGTTLLEQILSNHTQICGCGELPYINLYGHSLIFGSEKPSGKKLVDFANNYLLELNRRSNESLYAIDKSPGNFRAIGLILNALPNAKIIHIHRDPKAVGWSLYKNLFAENSLAFSYNIDSIIEFYRQYYKLMTYWLKIYDKRIMNVSYNDLISNPEPVIKKILVYLGLNWEQSLLNPELNARSVSTASTIQVRRPIYKGSTIEWLKWKSFLNGSFDSLDKFVFP